VGSIVAKLARSLTRFMFTDLPQKHMRALIAQPAIRNNSQALRWDASVGDFKSNSSSNMFMCANAQP
jgi:hypothetical protein